MSGTSSVPRPTYGPQGIILPSEADILAGVQADMNAAFGGNLNPALETPQGQLASSETAILADTFDMFLWLIQQFDPAYSEGRWQDSLGRIYFMTRMPAEPTSVIGTCRGLAGVRIPAGSLALALDGTMFVTLVDARIGPSGTVDVEFQATTPGPITCPAGSLNRIYRVLPGWDSVVNNADGVVGTLMENRWDFELRRQQSVASNSLGMLPSIAGAVLAIPGVLDLHTNENVTALPVVLDGITLPPHSLYVCVAGGDPQAVAEAIWSKKSVGCDMAGNTTRTVHDDRSGFAPPYPAYQITFQTAIAQNFAMRVELTNNHRVPSDVVTQVSNAILNAWAGLDGGPRMRIGSPVYASRFYSAVASLGAWVQLIDIKIGSSAAPAAIFDGSINGGTLDVQSVTQGQLVVGQTLQSDAVNIPPGTQIVSFGTGTGLSGTYTISNTGIALPIGTSLMSYASNQDREDVGIAHIPVLAAPDITVVLR